MRIQLLCRCMCFVKKKLRLQPFFGRSLSCFVFLCCCFFMCPCRARLHFVPPCIWKQLRDMLACARTSLSFRIMSCRPTPVQLLLPLLPCGPLPGEASLRSALHMETVKGHARLRSHVPIVPYHVVSAYACATAAAFASLRAFAGRGFTSFRPAYGNS